MTCQLTFTLTCLLNCPLSSALAQVRALALRVMSSIRVPEIVQIQLLAVKKCASDSSPYVRKCAANAIPKIYSVDREQAEPLVRWTAPPPPAPFPSSVFSR